MSGVSNVPLELAPPTKPLMKRKKRSILNDNIARKSSSIADVGWAQVNIENMQIEGFHDGCAFALEELTDYRVQIAEDGSKILCGGVKSQIDREKVKKRKTSNCMAQQPELEEKLKPNFDDLITEKKINFLDKSKKKSKRKSHGGSSRQEHEKVETVALKDVKLPKWDKFKLHPLLMQSLQTSGFSFPTCIQERALLPAILDNRDVVGAAPTGSGKTLAFGLPILSQLLREREQPGYTKDCKAIILTPTRELAIQIQQHLENMVRKREIGVVTLVGGMAVQKQRRILSYRPEIVIGTPGRLWDIIDSNHEHLKDLASTLRFLVVDEADRMLQPGSYPELEKIFHVLRRKSKPAASYLSDLSCNGDDEVAIDEEKNNGISDNEGDDNIDIYQFANGKKVTMLGDVLKMQRKQLEEADDAKNTEKNATKAQKEVAVVASRHVRQTFLYSATLTIPEAGRFQKSKKKTTQNALTVLERVMKRVGLRGKPAVVDLSIAEPDSGIAGVKPLKSKEAERKLKYQQINVSLSMPAGLELCQYEVTDFTRDSFLYYFLTQYPGRTIIFLNAIHQVRKLTSLLTLLSLPVFALHAEMQQRQRLKKLDGFRSHANGILVATDVAARGLDIPSVDHVVHYHIARSTEVFVHRSGRTARANKDGLSISLVSPADVKNHLQICKMLQRPTGLSDFPFDHRYLKAIDERVRLAKSINEQDNAAGKLKAEATWFKQMAAAADLEMDEDLMFELGAKKRIQENMKRMTVNQSVQSLRSQLNRLLATPLRPVGSARKFRQLHKEMGSQISNDGEYCARNASEDLASKGKQSYKRFRRRK